MKGIRQFGLCLTISAALGLLLWLVFPSFWEDCLLSATTGRQDIQYVQTAVDGNGTVYAVGRQSGGWRLVRADDQGASKNAALKKLGITGVVSVDELHACTGGGAIITVYEETEDLLCRAYYIAPGENTAQMIFSASCGDGSEEDVRLSGFSEERGTSAFLVEQGGEMTVWCFTPGDESARKMADLTPEETEATLYALPDGTAALASENALDLGGDTVRLPDNLTPITGWHLQNGACLLDGRTGALWRVAKVGGEAECLLTLEDMPDAIDLYAAEDGNLVLLTDGGDLRYWRAGTEHDISSLLYRPQWQSILFLALGALAVILAALLLWYVLWELRKMQISLMVRYSAAAAAVLALLAAAAAHWFVRPYYEEQTQATAETYLRTAALAAPEPVADPLGVSWDYDESLTTRSEYVYALWRAFGSPEVAVRYAFDDVEADSPYLMAVEWALAYNITAGTGANTFGPDDVLTSEQAFTFLYRAMRYIGGDRMVLTSEDGTLYSIGSDGNGTVLTAELLGAKFRRAAETALETGNAFVQYTDHGTDYYAAFSKAGADRLTVISTQARPYQMIAQQGASDTARLLWASAAMALGIVIFALAALSRSLRRVTEGMSAIQRGSYVEVVDRGGDEVSAMAEALNHMSRSLRDADEQKLRRGEIYARFLPARITDLLGVPSVESIDKQTFASRQMTIMYVRFCFSEQIYEDRSKKLFDHVNEVTGATAKIISEQGGTILSFSHEGFNALFDPDCNAPISAAVAIQQEIISINRERSRRDLSPVTLRIAISAGEVMLGVVGDEARIQVAAVSPGLNALRALDVLFDRFEANILCTERIERWAAGYGSRYIGKTHDGNELIRVYEIYDGDPYSVRQGKAESEKAFSEGVYTLYAGEFTAAKRIFMEIVRRNNGDGAARHYLYLADRFEKAPLDEICLDC